MTANSLKLLKPACISAAALALLLSAQFMNNSALAQDAKPNRPWTVNCASDSTGALQCQMSQTMLVAKTRQRLLSVAIARKKNSAFLVMRVALPHGVYLPAGVSMTIDAGTPKTFAIQQADQNGSYTSQILDEATIETMKKGNKLTFGLQNGNKKPLALELSLAGFTESLSTLK